jgi:hypothetical protein
MKVKRGLLTLTEERNPFKVRIEVSERVERALTNVRSAPQGAFVWKELWQTFKHLSASLPDHHGRRLRNERSLTKARYVARVAYRAWKGRGLPEGRSWGHLRSAILVVYEELSG